MKSAPQRTSTSLPALSRATTVTQIVTVLTDRILNGELRPGTPLREESLAAQLGVSRNTLREGIQQLVHLGLARHQPHRGASVAALSAEDVRDLFSVRRLVELSAVQLPGRLSDTLDRALADAVHALEIAVDKEQWTRVLESDLHFHRLIVSRHGSPRITQSFDAILAELRVGLLLVDVANDTVGGLAAKHRRIHTLLARGERRQCRVALSRHLDESERKMLAALRRHAD